MQKEMKNPGALILSVACALGGQTLLASGYAWAAESPQPASRQAGSPNSEEEANIVHIALQHKLHDADQRNLRVAPQPLTFYENTILAVDYLPIDELAAVPSASIGTLETLGTLEGKRVVTATYPSGLVAVLVERQQNLFLPVLYVHRRAPIEKLEIVNTEGHEFLAYVADLTGTADPKEPYYFALVDDLPRRVDYRPALNQEFSQHLPQNYTIRGIGGFDIEALTFTNWVWRDTDANCCPSGGRITVDFGFDNGSFVVESSEWDPESRP